MPQKKSRDRRRIVLDTALSAAGVAALLTAEIVGLHVVAGAIFGVLTLWHGWSQRALLKAAARRLFSRKRPARPWFQALNLALAAAIAATLVTGVGELGLGVAAGHSAFANLSLLLAGAHIALSWRRILMLASGGRLGRRRRTPASARPATVAATS